MIVVAEDGDDRHPQPLAQLARERSRLVGLPVVGEITAEEQRVRAGGDVVEQRPERLGLVASEVQVGDGGEPDFGAVRVEGRDRHQAMISKRHALSRRLVTHCGTARRDPPSKPVVCDLPP